MVHHEIDEDADSVLLSAMGELDKVAERPVAPIDAVVIGNVVAVVTVWRRLERHQPNRRYAEAV
jgi:hypothetical protein